MANVNCTVEIMRNSDGVIRQYKWEWDVDGDAEYELEHGCALDPFFMWSDGNYACDCTRDSFFAEAAGEADTDIPCGMELYSVQIITPDGAVVYKDGKFDP